MSGIDYVVPPRSWDKIAALADDLRHQFGLAHEPYFPIDKVLEEVLDHQLGWLHFQVRDKASMGATEGATDPGGKFIILREDVYAALCAGEGRARFTAAHELGHLVLHVNTPLARATLGDEPFFRSEPQANQYAAELLMPREFMMRGDTASVVAERHGVSLPAANARLDFLARRRLI